MSTLFSQARTRIPRFADAAVERARLTVVPSRPVDAPCLLYTSDAADE